MKENIGNRICICGLVFDLECDLPFLNPFICHSHEKSDGRILFCHIPLLNESCGLVAHHDDVDVYRGTDGTWIYVSPVCKDFVQVGLSADYREITWYIPVCRDESVLYHILRNLLRMAFESVFAVRSRVSLHSACIDVQGEAVAFTGVSGLGKSTRASAWIDALGAEFISGDRPSVSVSDDGATACGVPWDGKEGIYRNTDRKLKAILEVRRSDSVFFRKLSPEQATKILMKQVFIPMWDTSAASQVIMTAKKLAAQVPVYRFFCGPEVRDAEEAYGILFNNPEKILEVSIDMKIKEGFALRKVADEFIVMPTGSNIARFDGAIALNEVSAFIFEKLLNPLSKEDLLAAVLDEYDVDRETAAKDIDSIIAKFDEMGILG